MTQPRPPMIYHGSLVAALLAASSCAPSERVSQAVPPRAPATGKQLLHDLALDVPDRAELSAALTPAAADDAAAAFVPAAPPFLAAARSDDDAARAVDCLTAAVYYEARSEPIDGQRAVAQVVLNRVRDRAFPKSVCGVVYQGSTRHTGCQFSFTCDGSMAAARDERSWLRSRGVAEQALAGSVYAPIGAATFYHTGAVYPWWAPSLARIGMVGSHIFYRWRGAMERALSFRQAYAGAEPVAPTPFAAAAGTTIAGVDDSGVTVHRGQSVAAITPAVASDVADTASGVTVHVGPRRLTVASGVRIHVGVAAPRERVAPVVDSQGAIIGEEGDPI
jgi:spore germination cell wall hydrolase CwlJ-like protein